MMDAVEKFTTKMKVWVKILRKWPRLMVYQLMNEDNKNMLEKVKTASTNNEVVDLLMKDPVTGRGMSYRIAYEIWLINKNKI